ncbi:aminoglycoside phosphotransferase family protein [Desulfothermus sp.]
MGGVLDKIIRRCPRLGHEVSVKYCLVEKGNLPCERLMMCWGDSPSLVKLFRKILGKDRVKTYNYPHADKLIQLADNVKKIKQHRRDNMFSLTQIHAFFNELYEGKVRCISLDEFGKQEGEVLKDFGYGKPIIVNIEFDSGEKKDVVISTMRGDEYGHQYYWDRARILMFQYETGGKLDKHVRPVAIGYMSQDGLIPVKGAKEFFIVNERVNGEDYYLSLDRIKKGDFREEDIEFVKKLARYLAKIHSQKYQQDDLYIRRIRNLIGDCECIFGIIDGYPYPYNDYPEERFIQLEKELISWRWKLKKYCYRLCVVHGDFHPWNVLVTGDNDFWVLDRSRGEYGEAADDVATMACNYILYGLYDRPKITGPFEKMYMTFFEEYLSYTEDKEILEVIAPFFVFRALVIASPKWYPNHPKEVRAGLFRFMENILKDEKFDYKNINKYMQG